MWLTGRNPRKHQNEAKGNLRPLAYSTSLKNRDIEENGLCTSEISESKATELKKQFPETESDQIRNNILGRRRNHKHGEIIVEKI